MRRPNVVGKFLNKLHKGNCNGHGKIRLLPAAMQSAIELLHPFASGTDKYISARSRRHSNVQGWLCRSARLALVRRNYGMAFSVPIMADISSKGGEVRKRAGPSASRLRKWRWLPGLQCAIATFANAAKEENDIHQIFLFTAYQSLARGGAHSWICTLHA